MPKLSSPSPAPGTWQPPFDFLRAATRPWIREWRHAARPQARAARLAIPLASYRWETGPELEMNEKWLAKWLAAFFRGGPQNGRANGWNLAIFCFLPVRPFARPFFGHFGTLPKNGRRPFRQPFFGHFQFRARFPLVAGQLDRNARRGFKQGWFPDFDSSVPTCPFLSLVAER